MLMALDILAKAIASQNVMKLSSIALHLVTCLKICIISSFISTIPIRLINNFLDYVPILLNMLSFAIELLKADEDKKAENIKLFITQCISFHIEWYHQSAFISPFISQIVFFCSL